MDGDIAGMLRQVMENPQFGSMMQAMKTQMGGGDGAVDPAKMMEKLPEMMTVLGPVMQGILQGTKGDTEEQGSGGQKKGEDGPPEEPEKGTENREIPAGGEPRDGGKEPGDGGGNSGMLLFRQGSREKRNKLLSALKPYLSPARCAMVDRAMSAMQLGEILGTMAPSGKQEG